jgi:hypothetical protein
MAFRSLSDMVSHFFESMYPRQMYFTGFSRLDGATIRGLFSLPIVVQRRSKSTNEIPSASPFPPLVSQPRSFLVIFSALIKLCRIKGKIKGGWNLFLTGSTKDSDISGQTRGPRLQKVRPSLRLAANFNTLFLS